MSRFISQCMLLPTLNPQPMATLPTYNLTSHPQHHHLNALTHPCILPRPTEATTVFAKTTTETQHDGVSHRYVSPMTVGSPPQDPGPGHIPTTTPPVPKREHDIYQINRMAKREWT